MVDIVVKVTFHKYDVMHDPYTHRVPICALDLEDLEGYGHICSPLIIIFYTHA